jgi:hypothetical protein
MKAIARILLLSAAVFTSLAEYGAHAAGFDFSTTTATNWTTSGGGAVDVTPYQYGTDISVTSTAFSNGTFLLGGSLAQFDGFWTAKCAFFLPYGATKISLVYSNLTADDRAVLMLNGAAIGATGTQTTSGGTQGYMVFTDGGPLESYYFSGPDATVSGSATSGFIVGDANVLQAIVNNTRDGVAGTTLRTLTTTDGTTFRVKGAVSYSLTPPRLTITRSGTSVLVSWSTNYTGFQLETSTNLPAPQSWASLPAAGNSYTTPHTSRAAFFRLVQQ